MSPVLPEFPWNTLLPYRERARRAAERVVDLSVGSPVDPTPDTVREALAEAGDAHAYPQTIGTPRLREAIVGWYARRHGVTDLGEEHVLPLIGSKEFIAHLAWWIGLGPEDVVVYPRAAYPTYAIGAALAGARTAVADRIEDWPERTRLVWLNSPGNPDGSVRDEGFLAAAVERARSIGALIVNDECYAELGWSEPWLDAPTPTIVSPRVRGAELSGVLSVYSLSKQSNLAGYRAAFAAGDAEVLGRVREIRKHSGLMVPAPIQRAMVAALGDDAHVAAQKERYRARRAVLSEALGAAGFRIDRSEAGLYLWATAGADAWQTVGVLADAGIVAVPGTFYGDGNGEHLRFSLTATDEDIALAAARLGALAPVLPGAATPRG